MKKSISELVIGQRYWLDRMKDVSGVYKGIDESHGNAIIFNDVIGTSKYMPRDEHGTVGFEPFPDYGWEPVTDETMIQQQIGDVKAEDQAN
jgi:hypothetical protein